MKKFLSRIFSYWMALGHLIGLFMTPIQMFLVYTFAIGPVNLGARLLGKDPLDRKLNNRPTFWRKKDVPAPNLENMRHTF